MWLVDTSGLDVEVTFQTCSKCNWWIHWGKSDPEPAIYPRCSHWFPGHLTPSVSVVLLPLVDFLLQLGEFFISQCLTGSNGGLFRATGSILVGWDSRDQGGHELRPNEEGPNLIHPYPQPLGHEEASHQRLPLLVVGGSLERRN